MGTTMKKRFHDPEQDSVFANSQSVSAFSTWSRNAESKSASGSTTPVINTVSPPFLIKVKSGLEEKSLPSLVTPTTAQGKRIRYVILEYDTLIDSSEVEMSDWIRIASDIERNYSLFDSFVVLHGTDTMAYSASALSFLLEDLGKTVILTGAQIPLSELFNDSVDNLLGALVIAGHYVIPEVCLFFNHKLFRGNRTIKASSEEFDAFESPNLAPLATVGIEIDVDWGQVLRPGLRPFRAHKKLCHDVATLRLFPGITGTTVRAMLSGQIKGVVLATYGAGNAPKREDLLAAFREAAERGVIIVNVSQCTTGAVAPDIYETGRMLAAVGIIGGADMTVECALAKLSYLLSKPELSPAQIRQLIARPLRGELTLSPACPTFSTPTLANERLRSLFSRVIDFSSSSSNKGYTRTRSLSGNVNTAISPSSASAESSLPTEYDAPWPATLKDAEAAESAMLPFLLGQAAAQPGPRLQSLIESLTGESQSKEDGSLLPAAQGDHASTGITLLNEASTSSLQTPVHLAVLTGQLENVELLLAKGASVHARDILSHSALFYAARLGLNGLSMVKALRGAGAHFGEVEIERGDVGLEILRARQAGDERVLDVWKQAGADVERSIEVVHRMIVGPSVDGGAAHSRNSSPTIRKQPHSADNIREVIERYGI